ncbi:MAG: Gfo/Idh/MocA family oxidoreductase [Nitrospira sp.]|nr:Gfo/Idh/MocA family oxidoreductase [Nitrospira sp.]
MLKVGIIGCGKIADAHVEQLIRVAGCEIVGVCDREELMAKQLYERFPIRRYFKDVDALLDIARPDVVHITTPPQSHFALGRQCLEAGCHVYIEKPFTVNAVETESLIGIAIANDKKITVGHDDQFTPAARKMRELIQEGYLGSGPVHMESYYCYDLGDPSYAKEVLGDKNHWVRQLPGKLFHNNISHGICRIAEFIVTDSPKVVAEGFVSQLMKRINEEDIVDELRVIVSDGETTTAYFTFSSQMRPVLKHFRIYGQTNGLEMNHDQQTIIKVRGQKYKSYMEKFIPPYNFARQYVGNSLANMHSFVKREFHMKSGMKFLIESFYQSILHGSPLPISYREILLTAKIIDAISTQINEQLAAKQPVS